MIGGNFILKLSFLFFLFFFFLFALSWSNGKPCCEKLVLSFYQLEFQHLQSLFYYYYYYYSCQFSGKFWLSILICLISPLINLNSSPSDKEKPDFSSLSNSPWLLKLALMPEFPLFVSLQVCNSYHLNPLVFYNPMNDTLLPIHFFYFKQILHLWCLILPLPCLSYYLTIKFH